MLLKYFYWKVILLVLLYQLGIRINLFSQTVNGDNTVTCYTPEGKSKYNFLPSTELKAKYKPIPEGGENGFNKYWSSASNKILKKKKITVNEIVYITCIITSAGNAENIRILRGAKTKGLNEAAIDIIKKMPKWTPSIYEEKKYDYEYTLSLKFKNTK